MHNRTLKGLLVTLCGYPQTPSCFMPDNGLAGIAALIKELGHQATILDYNTPQMIRRLFPQHIKKQLLPLQHKLLGQAPLAEGDYALLDSISSQLSAFQCEEYKRIGQELSLMIESNHIDWIGFKVWNGDGYTASKLMSSVIKSNHPDLPIIAGGPHVDYFMEYILESTPGFDFVAFAEGEPTIPVFLDFLLKKAHVEDIPNLIYRKNNSTRRGVVKRIENLNQLPLAIYDEDVYPSFYNNQKVLVGAYEETRGCPTQCNFCAHPVKSGAITRQKDVNLAINELQVLKERYGFLAYKFGGSFTPTKYLESLCRKMIDKNLNIDFVTYGHIGDSRTVNFDLLKQAGCFGLFFGVESGSELILKDKINKQHNSEIVSQVLKRAKKAGIFTIASIIYPNLGETEETRTATLDLIKDVEPDSVPCHWPILIPNTNWSDNPEQYGFRVPSREVYLDSMLDYKAKLLFPPQYWDALEYKIGEKDFGQYSRENAEFVAEIEKLNILTLVGDDTALMADIAGMTARKFRDLNRKAFVLGDADCIQDYVNTINENLKAKLINDKRCANE